MANIDAHVVKFQCPSRSRLANAAEEMPKKVPPEITIKFYR
jgi:hypothetical protein